MPENQGASARTAENQSSCCSFVHLSHEPRKAKGGIGVAISNLLETPGARRSFSHCILIGPAHWPDGNGCLPRDQAKVLHGADCHFVIGQGAESLPTPAKEQMEALGQEFNVQFEVENPSTPGQFDTTIILIRFLDDPCSPANLTRASEVRMSLQKLGVNVPIPAGPPFDDNALMGLLLAKVASAAADSVLLAKRIEKAVWCGHEYFSLPFLYLVSALGRRPHYRTIAYLSQNHLVTETIDAEIEGGGPGVAFYWQMNQSEDPFQVMQEHPSYGLLRAVHNLDCVAAVSPSVAREVMALQPALASKGVTVIPHGIKLGSSAVSKQRAKTELFNRLPDSVRPFASDPDPLLLLKIARPEKTKALHRDLLLLTELDRLIQRKGVSAVYLLVTCWTDDAIKNPNKRVAERKTFVADIENANQTLTNTRIVLFEEFDFPASLGLSRSVLLEASDVVLMLSSYESFGLSAWEAIEYGAVAAVSSAAGSISWLRKRYADPLTSHSCLVVADYLETYEHLVRTGNATPDCVEQIVAAEAAQSLLTKLLLAPEDRIKAGRVLVKNHFAWSAAGELFAEAVRHMFAQPRCGASASAVA